MFLLSPSGTRIETDKCLSCLSFLFSASVTIAAGCFGVGNWAGGASIFCFLTSTKIQNGWAGLSWVKQRIFCWWWHFASFGVHDFCLLWTRGKVAMFSSSYLQYVPACVKLLPLTLPLIFIMPLVVYLVRKLSSYYAYLIHVSDTILDDNNLRTCNRYNYAKSFRKLLLIDYFQWIKAEGDRPVLISLIAEKLYLT